MSVLEDDCTEAIKLAMLHDDVCTAYMILQLTRGDKLIGPEPDASVVETLRSLADAMESRIRRRAN